jgi:HPr kinase/phosphorylase
MGKRHLTLLISMCEDGRSCHVHTRQVSGFIDICCALTCVKHFADRTSMHGVFMDILGVGVMITGESGLGKSELGLG